MTTNKDLYGKGLPLIFCKDCIEAIKTDDGTLECMEFCEEVWEEGFCSRGAARSVERMINHDRA